MDANRTRFHLLLGETDWARCVIPDGSGIFSNPASSLEWDPGTRELRLHAEPFRFRAGSRDQTASINDRRGAAADPYLNWFWISDNREEIRIQSSGESVPSHFWSAADMTPKEPPAPHAFRPIAPVAPRPAYTLSGLAVTEDHYLVAGTIAPDGILVFDLLGGGPPHELRWPVRFTPFDMEPRRGGGVWILDRANARYWVLDRTLRVIPEEQTVETVCDDGDEAFQSADGTRRPRRARTFPTGIACGVGSPIEAENPVSITALPDGTVFILDVPPTGPSRLLHYRMSTLLRVVDLPFRAHDVVVREDRVYVAPADGNQAIAYTFVLTSASLSLTRLDTYFPMRRFAGKALLNSVAGVHYDFGERWVPLVAQPYSRHAPLGTLWTHARRDNVDEPGFDGRDPQCVWHRLLFDGCIPPGTAVEVWSRAADEPRELELMEWSREPDPHRRGDGSELPYARPAAGNRGTFELLLQKARGRYLQLQLRLSGDGRLSPRIHALRIYYPRFSYLEHYLPAVYRENPESASFLDRFLANIEGTNTAIEDRIASAQLLFDVRSAPPETLNWLASWFGVVLDPAWDEARSRLFLRHATTFFQWRGTIRGLRMALRLAFEPKPDEGIFDLECCDRTGERFRIVERFRSRRIPAVQFGDPSRESAGPSLLPAAAAWTPKEGAGALQVRYHAATGQSEFSLRPLATPTDEAARTAFAQRVLGFVPSDPTDEVSAWARHLQSHGWTGATTYPAQAPADPELAKLWRSYQAESQGQPYGRRRRLWQQFLARRYISVKLLGEAHRAPWESFESVAYPVTLPSRTPALRDWFEFETRVLPTLAAAHRFSVLLPVSSLASLGEKQRTQRLALANRLIMLEKPAHTTFDVRFFWALFRLGEVRLGADSVLGLGARDPAFLHQLAVTGQSYLGESFLSPSHPPSTAGRIITGRDRLNNFKPKSR
jgi:phage tail-like protein